MRLFLALVVCASAANAQVIEVRPPNPTATDAIVLRIGLPVAGLARRQSVTVTGSRIDITFRGSSNVPIGAVQDVAIGLLPAGVYSVVVTFLFENDEDEIDHVITLPPFSLAVGEGYFVPALDYAGLAVLAAGMALAAIAVLKQR